MTDGSQQDQRFPPALADGSILVDGATLADRLAMIRDHAQALSFRDSLGTEVGRWNDLLDGDEAVLMARSLALRVGGQELGFLDAAMAAREDLLERRLHGLVTWLDEWLKAVKALSRPEFRALGERLELHIANLLGPTWRVGAGAAVAGAPGEFRKTYFALVKAVRATQLQAAAQFEAALAGQTHDPAAALLVALAQVFGRVQDRINDFQQRHLDFYYHRWLKLEPHGAQPDKAHVIVERDPTFPGEVVIPEGQRFVVGRSGAGRDIVFTATDPLVVTDAKVVALKTLRLERNPLISPECVFGLVTRARVAEYGAEIGPSELLRRDPASVMGGAVPGCIPSEIDARVGLAFSSPILWLSQGERSIELRFAFERPPKAMIRKDLEAAHTVEAFSAALGRLLASWLLSDDFTVADMAEFRALALAAHAPAASKTAKTSDAWDAWDAWAEEHDDVAADLARPSLSRTKPFIDSAQLAKDEDGILALLLGEDPDPGPNADAETKAKAAKAAAAGLATRRALARGLLFPDLFDVEVSTADGWFKISEPVPLEDPIGGGALPRGPGLRFHLRHEDPELVACSAIHGAGWPTEAPVLRLTTHPQARICPISLLDWLPLRAIEIDVGVEGLRDLRVFNQLGRLDPAKPFQPFGPLPDMASYLVIGSPEAARKQITDYRLTLDWAGLPPDGFADYYDGYGADLSDEVFKITPTLLRDGRWAPAGPQQSMFQAPVGGGATSQEVRLDPEALQAWWRPTERDLVFDQNARNGFVKLGFSAPQDGFGHNLYPSALASSLRASLKHPTPPPRPPYTPILAGMTLGYSASTQLRIGAPAGAELILHQHPFGLKTIHPARVANHPPCGLPSFGRDGHLIIGLSAQALEGELTLLFEMRPDTAAGNQPPLARRPPLEWSWLADDVWTPLGKNRVVTDTTRGLLSTGIVKLDLPPGLAMGNTILPGDLFWLRVSSDLLSDAFAGLVGVQAQALLATRVLDAEAPDEPLPAGTIMLKSASIPGVLSLRQPAIGFGQRRAETPRLEHTRIGERLRHKGRASTAWDYERLVLEAFPSVYKVRCLPNTVPKAGDTPPGGALPCQPGHVLLTVVPAAPADLRSDPLYSTRAMRLDAAQLETIERFLPPLASPLARIRVINATYEYIQVRCAVELKRGAQVGEALTRINAALINFLSPWSDGGNPARFDWVIRGQDVESCVRALDDVVSVAGVSLLRVWEDDRVETRGVYRFEDTALNKLAGNDGRQDPTAREEPPVEVRASRPWSLALPFKDHIIELIGQPGAETGVRATGIAWPGILNYADAVAGLQIGETFIVEEAS